MVGVDPLVDNARPVYPKHQAISLTHRILDIPRLGRHKTRIQPSPLFQSPLRNSGVLNRRAAVHSRFNVYNFTYTDLIWV